MSMNVFSLPQMQYLHESPEMLDEHNISYEERAIKEEILLMKN